ncbi:MAG: trypsin-like serine protease [Hyphomonas sp.]|uniref:S1 family peptidase n=1 Tax=Hyphomonas sp. TaxID=87 RepID=UPI0017DBE8AD|nr:trypsin-like serine protease [Hyphomonas sp.]MBU3919031.1 trypsin-like serine protease [Alphaproteobacteria bacterium]MBA3069428.1 trypsin-like serine protease [Hyphomonas sp.]MBU4063810.1 trypsin-like serine protease [Alphaproteobacteria bacterium]MBU4164229.1 trypsin-like serine protease [Alphaproteobacteria bacterium]MBU4567427.1 trypsin-like serine protease [Alphaproteobacteria bacterium]
MKRAHLLAVAGLAALLSACDQVRLPGIDSAAPEPAAGTTDTAPDADANLEAAETGLPVAAEPAGDAETPTVDRDAAEPEAAADPAAETASAARTDLALYNATRCALPQDAPPTLTVAAVAGATQLEEPVAGPQAVNALAATLSAFPGIVKLEPRRTDDTGLVSSGHCGAVRVRANWFVTAAHCVDQPFDEIRMIGEAANLRSPDARTTTAEGAICHGGYLGTDNSYANDIALVRMSAEQAAAFANVPVARIGATGQPLAPANYPSAEMAGWGLTRFGGQLSSDLLMTPLKITAVGPAAITVASQGGAGPCIGDSGGPLYVTEADGTKTVVGILSVVEQNKATGQFCAGDYNGRYTNLQGYTGWIDSVIALCEAEPEACK